VSSRSQTWGSQSKSKRLLKPWTACLQ
jgi:hypothetical protein